MVAILHRQIKGSLIEDLILSRDPKEFCFLFFVFVFVFFFFLKQAIGISGERES